MLAVVGGLIAPEQSTPCPPGGVLGFDCDGLQAIVIRVLGLSAVLYVALLSGVVLWTGRSAAARSAARDWYLLVAVVGLIVVPLAAFTLLAALGSLG